MKTLSAPHLFFYTDQSSKSPGYIFSALLVGASILAALLVVTRQASAQTSTKSHPQDPPGTSGTSGTSTSPDCAPGWILVPSPNQGTDYNFLNGVAAISNNDVWSVGAYHNVTLAGNDQTLIEHWDGNSWIQVLSPNQSTEDNYLEDVTAINSNNVWAVGGYQPAPSAPSRTLIHHWNGNAWSVVSSPNTGTRSNNLFNIDALANNDIWAVGGYAINDLVTQHTLIEHWNGTAWSVVPSPNRGTDENALYGVTAVTANNAWAVGTSLNTSTGFYETLIEHWNGTAWNIVSSPNESGSRNFLGGVAAVANNDIWAVGDYQAPAGGIPLAALIEHWNGTAWSIVPNPVVSANGFRLFGLVAISANNVWASGSYNDAPSTSNTLIEHWDGTAWNVVSSPSRNVTANFLGSISAVSDSDIWAVGLYYNGVDRTLTERFNPCPATCPTQFEDVPSNSTFYLYVETMACNNIISGYPCGGPGEPCGPGNNPYFRPNSNVTRGQIAKIVALSAGITTQVSGQTFYDVPPGSTYYTFTEQLSSIGVMSGYPCGGAGEPCGPGNKPYFRPNSTATRGQLAKIDSNTAHYVDTPSGQLFEDVAPGTTYYTFTQRLARRDIMSGYPCGGAGEPCGPGNKPYFRPSNNVTRGQTSKIVTNTFFP